MDFVKLVRNEPETEAEKELVSEVLKIKSILDHKRDDQSESDVCELLLLKLQGMDISVKILQKTDIGKTVSSFRKHKSFDIREIATTVTSAWRVKVNEFVDNMDKKEDDLEELEKNKVKQVISANKRPVIRIKIKKVEISSEKEGGINCPVTPDQQPLWNKKDQVKERTISCNERIPFKHDSEKVNHNGNYMAENSITKAPNLLKPILKQARMSSATEKEKNGDVGICFEQKLEATKRKLHQNYMEVQMTKKMRQTRVLELNQEVYFEIMDQLHLKPNHLREEK